MSIESSTVTVPESFPTCADAPWLGADCVRLSFADSTDNLTPLVDMLEPALKEDPDAYIGTTHVQLSDEVFVTDHRIVLPNIYFYHTAPGGKGKLARDEVGNVIRDHNDMPVIIENESTAYDDAELGRFIVRVCSLATAMTVVGYATYQLSPTTVETEFPETSYSREYYPQDVVSGDPLRDLCYSDAASAPNSVDVYTGAGKTFILDEDANTIVVNGASTNVKVTDAHIDTLVVCGASTNTYVENGAEIDNLRLFGASTTLEVDKDSTIHNDDAISSNTNLDKSVDPGASNL